MTSTSQPKDWNGVYGSPCSDYHHTTGARAWCTVCQEWCYPKAACARCLAVPRGRPNWDEYFLGIAEAASKRATCPRRQVGAVLVDNNRVISLGYNGAGPRQPHCTDVGCHMVDGHCKRAIHAEINALTFRPVGYKPTENSVLYCTLEFCPACRAIAEDIGIKHFVWRDAYAADHS